MELNLAYLNQNEMALLFNSGTNNFGATLNIFDITGRLLNKKVIEAKQNTYIINTTNYATGMYILQVSMNNSNAQKSFKLIK